MLYEIGDVMVRKFKHCLVYFGLSKSVVLPSLKKKNMCLKISNNTVLYWNFKSTGMNYSLIYFMELIP